MSLFDDSSFEEQLWTDLWIEEAEKESAEFGIDREEISEIQDDIDSGLYTKEEIKDLYSLDDSDLDSFDTFMIDDDI